MNNFVSNVERGAQGVVQGVKNYGNTMVNGAKNIGMLGGIGKDVLNTFSKKKTVAGKMATPALSPNTSAPLKAPATLPAVNGGFKSYQQRLNDAMNY